MPSRWSRGELIVRREVLGLAPAPSLADPTAPWHRRPWMAVPVYVVEDTPDALVTYLATDAEFGFPPGAWPTSDGRHPWHGRAGWTGHGTLMVQRPGEHHAVWHFWSGTERELTCWYINLQTAFVRTPLGVDTQDLELDIIVWPDGRWELKDLDLLDDRVAEGRYTPELTRWVVDLGAQLTGELDAGRRWWDPAWARWEPDPAWTAPRLPPGWEPGAAT